MVTDYFLSLLSKADPTSMKHLVNSFLRNEGQKRKKGKDEKLSYYNETINPRPPEPFSVTRPPKQGLLQPPLDFL